jgi:uncharacterized protein (TIGR00297 family)
LQVSTEKGYLSTEMTELSTVLSLFYTKFFGGFLLALLVAFIGWRMQALSSSGVWAAVISGGLIFGLGGIPWAVLLLTFFVSSSALSKAFSQRKRSMNEKFSKGSRRDWQQVLANGGLGVFLVLLYFLFPEKDWIWIAYVGAMAAVNADTWATEVGVLSRTPPRLIITGEVVERGTSGGITLIGSLAAFLGGLLVSLVAAFITPNIHLPLFILGGSLGGMAGALVDSVLGASVQGIYFCPSCQKETERHPLHSCGTETNPVRGWRWVNNEVVNFSCSCVGAIAAVALWFLF